MPFCLFVSLVTIKFFSDFLHGVREMRMLKTDRVVFVEKIFDKTGHKMTSKNKVFYRVFHKVCLLRNFVTYLCLE